MGSEKGTIQNMLIDYISNIKGGKIEGNSHHRWAIIGLN
ncbi:Ser/Thr protein phosphatase [Mannheimia pernigra]|nr:Ser/Thr protein phosphatase [Mannheimia pernigra]